MSDVLFSWQRKVGAGLLVIVVALVTLWVRTSATPASYVYDFGIDGEIRLASQKGMVSLFRQCFVEYRHKPVPVGRSSVSQEPRFHWWWHKIGYGFELGSGERLKDRCSMNGDVATIESEVCNISVIQIPYWSFVVPLALLSANLLCYGLEKSRRAELRTKKSDRPQSAVDTRDYESQRRAGRPDFSGKAITCQQ